MKSDVFKCGRGRHHRKLIIHLHAWSSPSLTRTSAAAENPRDIHCRLKVFNFVKSVLWRIG